MQTLKTHKITVKVHLLFISFIYFILFSLFWFTDGAEEEQTRSMVHIY